MRVRLATDGMETGNRRTETVRMEYGWSKVDEPGREWAVDILCSGYEPRHRSRPIRNTQYTSRTII